MKAWRNECFTSQEFEAELQYVMNTVNNFERSPVIYYLSFKVFMFVLGKSWFSIQCNRFSNNKLTGF